VTCTPLTALRTVYQYAQHHSSSSGTTTTALHSHHNPHCETACVTVGCPLWRSIALSDYPYSLYQIRLSSGTGCLTVGERRTVNIGNAPAPPQPRTAPPRGSSDGSQPPSPSRGTVVGNVKLHSPPCDGGYLPQPHLRSGYFLRASVARRWCPWVVFPTSPSVRPCSPPIAVVREPYPWIRSLSSIEGITQPVFHRRYRLVRHYPQMSFERRADYRARPHLLL
jgi:hypothetical protein